MIFMFDEVKRVLERHGYSHLCPDLKLPMVAVGGRRGRAIDVSGRRMTPEMARSILYCDKELAGCVTGSFLLKKGAAQLVVEIQVRKTVPITDRIYKKYQELFGVFPDTVVKLIPYHEFTHGMSVDYETKFRHLL